MRNIARFGIALALLPATSFAQTLPGAPLPAADGVVARLCRTAAACRAEADALLAKPASGATSALASNFSGKTNAVASPSSVDKTAVPAIVFQASLRN